MEFSIPRFCTFATISPNISKNSSSIRHPFIRFPQFSKRNTGFGCRSILRCYAAAKQQKGGGAPTTKKKRKPRNKNNGKSLIEDDFFVIEKGGGGGVELLESPPESPQESDESRYTALPLPKPPAGFVLDEQGKVLMASDKRLATIVDPKDNRPLECVIRRVFRTSKGDECMLLCPVDMPVLVLKSVNFEGWTAVTDDEVDAVLPNAAYALAKIHLHLVDSGFCYTARGGFCYTEEDILDFQTAAGEEIEGVPTEGIEITSFDMDGSHYMIYTPSDPSFFVAVKDENGELKMANDEILEDPAIVGAVDEEIEFNALVEEEAALLDSLLGRR